MPSSSTPINQSGLHWVVVRLEPAGQFTAQVVGLPEIRATAETRAQALHQVRTVLEQWLATGQLVPLEIGPVNPWLQLPGHTNPQDPCEKVYLDELERFRQSDLERTLREDELEDQRCSNSSSTPTT
jgi:hypothetical protein